MGITDELHAARVNTLAEALKAEIAASGLTRAELGRRAGLSAQHVTNMANGNREPTLNVLVRLGLALGFNVNIVQSLREGVMLSPDEERLLLVFRDLPVPAQRLLLAHADLMSDARKDTTERLLAELVERDGLHPAGNGQ